MIRSVKTIQWQKTGTNEWYEIDVEKMLEFLVSVGAAKKIDPPEVPTKERKGWFG